MIARISKGKNFRGVVAYVLGDKPDGQPDRAEVIGTNLGGRNPKEMAQEFEAVASHNSRVQKPVRHYSLRLPDQDKRLTCEQWQDLGSRFLERMGHGNCYHLMVLHHDSKNPHLHIITSAVDFKARKVNDYKDVYRAKQACRELEQAFGLVQVSNRRKCGYKTGNRKTWARHSPQNNKSKQNSTPIRHTATARLNATGTTPAPELAGLSSPSASATATTAVGWRQPQPAAPATTDKETAPAPSLGGGISDHEAAIGAELEAVKGQLSATNNPYLRLRLQKRAAELEQQLKAAGMAAALRWSEQRRQKLNRTRRPSP